MPEMESKDDIDPPIGWAQTAKVPPGWKDPGSGPGSGLRAAAFVLLIFGFLFSVFGNWVVAQPVADGAWDRTSEVDVILGVAALMLLVGVSLMVTALVVRYRSRRAK
jgi:hypothetical protein